LKPDTWYFLRSRVQNTDSETDESAIFYVHKTFKTPVQSGINLLVGSAWLLSSSSALTNILRDDHNDCNVIAITGSVYENVPAHHSEDFFRSQLSQLLKKPFSTVLSDLPLPVYSAQVHVAWNDLTPLSDLSIKEDERLIKKHAKELKRTKKTAIKGRAKYDTEVVQELKFPALPISLRVLAEVCSTYSTLSLCL
jgi:hypothetical protein